MPGRYLLDTSILIAVLRGEEKVGDRLRDAQEVFTSVITLGELYLGAERSERPRESRERVDALATDVVALSCDSGTADEYAVLKNRLWKKGRPIPDNDLWIAACAAQHGLTLVVRDRHFDALEDFDLVSW